MSRQFAVESIKIPISLENEDWEEQNDSATIDETDGLDLLSQKMKSLNNAKHFQIKDGINQEFTATKGLENKFKKLKNKTLPANLHNEYKIQGAQNFENSKFKHMNTLPLENNKEEDEAGIFENQKKRNPQEEYNNKIIEDDYWNLMYGPNFDKQVQQEHFVQTYSILLYTEKKLSSPSDEYLKKKQIFLPQATKSTKTLFLDLDETLIYSNSLTSSNNHIQVFIRPFAKYLIKKLSSYYELFIFTASKKAYATHIFNLLDPQHQYLKGMLTRDNCLGTKNGAWVKDLRVIKNRDLSQMLLVDNLAYSFAFQIDNGVPIASWRGDENDQELLYLTQYLIDIAKHQDIKTANRLNLRIKETIDAMKSNSSD